MSAVDPRGGRAGVVVLSLLAVGSIADAWTGWFTRAFDVVAHQFYEIALLAALRRPSQLALARVHVLTLGVIAALGLLLWSRLDRHRRWWWAAFLAAYAIRAAVWIAGGNLPLVPGDGSHYVEVASSVYRGEGPVKHYVESFFIPYPAIREGRGTLDDWATPLYAYVVAGAYRLVGVVPGASLEATFAVAKGTSFVLNLLCLPALYGLARRLYGRETGLATMWLLAILPVHAIYAGFELRESLVVLTSILSVWGIVEMWRARGGQAIAWAVAAGAAGGLAILARNTAMALLAACAVYGVLVHWRTHRVAMGIWAVAVAATISPWAWMTYQAYGEPFFTYTGFFRYTFSWAVHHYQTGAPTAAEFLTVANAPEIVRVKLKSLLIIALYSTMILSVPVMAAALARWRHDESDPSARDMNRLSRLLSAAFVLATLINVADVTQVAQLGRYYLPLYCLLLPAAAATMRSWSAHVPPRIRLMAVATLAALLWSDPTWAYDASWLTKSFQLRLPALHAAGTWIREHPEAVPADARIMTWFPWELRVMSQRTTILMPRNFNARRNLETIGDGPFGYHVTHVLWGSFEPPPPPIDPHTFAPYLEGVRLQTGLSDDKQIYRSPPGVPFPVRLYQLRPPPHPPAPPSR
jgi:4-amino-4-deoxy-L-arabinose transferase-like glycosyltransferase